MQSSSIFLPPTMAGRVCRIILLVLALVLGALLAVQATGTVPNSSMLIPGVFLLAMLDLLALSIIAVRKREMCIRDRSLAALLQGEYKPLAPFIGANYARRNRVMGRAALVAGNLRQKSLLPLLRQVAENEAPPAREHAAWAVQRILRDEGREAHPEG